MRVFCNYPSIVAAPCLRYVLIMVEAPTDAVPQILIKIQDSIGTLRSELGTLRSEVGTFRSEVGTLQSDLTPRLDRIENIVRKQRRDAAGMLVLMRAAASDFDDRISDLGERVSALEDRKR